MTRSKTRRSATVIVLGVLLLSGASIAAAANPVAPPDSGVTVLIPEQPAPVPDPTPTPTPPSAPSASSAPAAKPTATPAPSQRLSAGSPSASPNASANASPAATPAAATTPSTAVPALADQIVPVLAQGPSQIAYEAKLTAAVIHAGTPMTATVHGYTAGEKVRFVVYSSPVVVGDSVATTNGDAAATFAVPKALAAGVHTLEATGWVSHRVSNQTFVIVPAGTAIASNAPTDGRPWVIWLIAGGVLLVALIATGIAAARRSLPIFRGRPPVTTEGPEL